MDLLGPPVRHVSRGDPDGSRARLAIRATLTPALTALAMLPVGQLVSLPATAPVLGAMLGMMSTLVVGDGQERERRRTAALLLLPALGGLTVGTLLAPTGWGALAGMVLIVFTSVLAQRLGPRGTALGTIGFNAAFFAIFFHSTTAQLPGILLAAAIGVVAALAVRVLMVKERPARAATRVLATLPGLVDDVLGALVAALERSTPRRVTRVRQRLQRLNEATLMLDDHLDRSGLERAPELRRQAFELELAGGRVGAAALVVVRDPLAAPEVKRELARAIELARSRPAALPEAIARAREAAGGAPLVAAAIDRVGVALAAVLGGPGEARREASDWLGDTPLPARAPPPGLHPTTRLAIQTALASLLSAIVGRAIAADRWYWAVLACYVVVAPTTTRGETLVRAWRRTLGTMAGVPLGMLLAWLVSGHPRLELAVLFACVFLGIYWLKRNYAVMVLWFTAGLAILYAVLGRFTPGVMGVRILETAAGAACGAVVAALVLPSHTGGRLDRALGEMVAALARRLEALADLAAGSTSAGPTRELDRAIRELRTAAEPLSRGLFGLGGEVVEVVSTAGTLGFYTRQLAAPGFLAAAVAHDPRVRSVTEALSACATALAARDRVVAASALGTAATGLGELRAAASQRAAQHELDLGLLWLERIADALRLLTRTRAA